MKFVYKFFIKIYQHSILMINNEITFRRKYDLSHFSSNCFSIGPQCKTDIDWFELGFCFASSSLPRRADVKSEQMSFYVYKLSFYMLYLFLSFLCFTCFHLFLRADVESEQLSFYVLKKIPSKCLASSSLPRRADMKEIGTNVVLCPEGRFFSC